MAGGGLTQNFLYGDRSQGRRRAFLWGFKKAEAQPSMIYSIQDVPTGISDAMVDSKCDTRHNRQRTAQWNHKNPPKTSQDQRSRNAVRSQKSEPPLANLITPDPQSSQLDLFPMYSFSRLSSTVKQCPWILGSDMRPSAPVRDPDFYLPVPRSVKHDTAVSFVVTDQTRPEQPQFVISCALEHVDLVREVLAPPGSQRTLSARGSSGRPRDADELRSMLLDGTPSIELSLHTRSEIDVNVPADTADNYGNYRSRVGGSGQGRRHSFVRERPVESFVSDQNIENGSWPKDINAQQGFSQPFVPAMLVPHGWCAAPSGSYAVPRMENAGRESGDSSVFMSPIVCSWSYVC